MKEDIIRILQKTNWRYVVQKIEEQLALDNFVWVKHTRMHTYIWPYKDLKLERNCHASPLEFSVTSRQINENQRKSEKASGL